MDESSGSAAGAGNLDEVRIARSKQHSRETEMVRICPNRPVPSLPQPHPISVLRFGPKSCV